MNKHEILFHKYTQRNISSNIIFYFNFNFKNRWSNSQTKTSSPRLAPTCSRLIVFWALQIELMCLLCPYDLRTARKCTYFDLETSTFCGNSAETPCLNSSSAFRSGTSAPFLGQNKYICERFGVPVGTMDSRGPSNDLFRRVGWNYGTHNNYRNHVK
jgi:hypothetical protein